MTFDASGVASSASENQVAFRVIDLLRPHLSTLMGDGGFRALLSRALMLAQAEAPELAGTTVDASGALSAAYAHVSQPEAKDFLEGGVLLLAQLLGLLEAFIGPTLTSHIVGEIWPQFPLGSWDFGKEARSEDAS